MRCTFVSVYYEPQRYIYMIIIYYFVNVYYEPQQWHWFEYLSVHYRQRGDTLNRTETETLNKTSFSSGVRLIMFPPLLRLITNINQILIISCNIRWILILTSERNKTLTFFMGGSDHP